MTMLRPSDHAGPSGRHPGNWDSAQQRQVVKDGLMSAPGGSFAGDLLFFGTARWGSTATEQNVIHTGIYLGDNWVITSSGPGVYVLQLKGSRLGDSFAWGRRVIS